LDLLIDATKRKLTTILTGVMLHICVGGCHIAWASHIRLHIHKLRIINALNKLVALTDLTLTADFYLPNFETSRIARRTRPRLSLPDCSDLGK